MNMQDTMINVLIKKNSTISLSCIYRQHFPHKTDDFIKKGLTKNHAMGRIEETCLFSINHILITN